MSVEVGRLTLAQSASLLRAGSISPVELVDGYLKRISDLDGKLQSMITVCGDFARAQAKLAEREILETKQRSPLHGVPYTLKDVIHAKGVRTTAQSRVLKDYVASDNSHVQDLLAGAGGILLGKTATWEFTHGGPSWDVLAPPARNPWNLDYDTAGSSSGSCAAVAAGLCSASIGTDTGGSIRTPSAWCGVTGLKPTYGLVSRYGVLPNSFSQDHVGPIAWNVEDVALILETIAGYDPRDPGSHRLSIPKYSEHLNGAIYGLIVGIPVDWLREAEVADEVRLKFEAAVSKLSELGAQIREVKLPPLQQYEDVKRIIALCDLYSIHSDTLRTNPELLGDSLRYRIIAGCLVRADEYIGALRMRAKLAHETQQVFETVDILALPAAGVPKPLQPQPHESIFKGRSFNSPFNVSGNPALAMCTGFAANGLPLSMQLVGRLFSEVTVLRAGHQLEQAINARSNRPALN